jgi:hypothetical protein
MITTPWPVWLLTLLLVFNAGVIFGAWWVASRQR